jgi:hypothetical protein
MILQKPQDRSEADQRELAREIDSETWKDAYLSKMRESKKTGVPLIALCENDPVFTESHKLDLSRLKRYNASRTDAAPIVMYERD